MPIHTDLTNDEDPKPDAKLIALRAAIDEGDASRIAEGDVFACFHEKFKLSAKEF